MNLLKRQGFFNTIILNAGTALGFFNLIILFPRVLTLEQIGFYNLIIAISGLYAMFSSMGISNIVLRYYPCFRTDDKKHGGFVTFISLFSILSFIVFTVFFILLRKPVIDHYLEKNGASYLVTYYYYLIPLSLFTLAYTVLESLSRAVFRNVLSAFLKEVLLRTFTSVFVLIVVLKWMDYHDFVAAYIISNAAIALILLYSIFREKFFILSPISRSVSAMRKEMTQYGLFAVLSGGSFTLIQYLDTLMLSSMKNDTLVGIYGTFFGIAVVISLPAKALNRTSYQIVSNAWVENDLEKIGRIYHKTSVVQFLIGCLLFIGLIINRENIFILLKKAEFRGHFDIFILVAVAFLVDITGGLNSHIISSSRYYRLITYSLITGVGICVILNLLLIPGFGMAGAAIAYLVTMFLLNFSYWLFIKVKIGLQPFDISHLKIILIAIVCLLLGLSIPYIKNFFLDVTIRSLVVSVIYLCLAYYLKVSTDINDVINRALNLKYKG